MVALGRVRGFARGASLTNSINGMRIAGVALAIAICAAGSEANAQMRVFMGPGGSGNQQAPGSAGMGTSSLGLGGFGSATENLAPPTPDASQGLSFGENKALGVTGGAGGSGAGASQGSLSAAIDHPSSPINSVTNSLMGSIGTGTTIPAIKPAAKRKQNTKAAAASSSNGGAPADAKDNSSKTR
jgi:hypothetical protein